MSNLALGSASVKNKTTFSVEFPGSPITIGRPPKTIKIVERPNSHDIALFTLLTTDSMYEVLDGAPVVITWHNLRGGEQFHGYVYRVEPFYDANSGYAVNFVCVGASYPMMNKGTEVWVGATAPDVVREIALKHGLGVDTEPHPRVFNQIVQAGESYWQLLVRLAGETGYVLRMEGSTVVFRSRESLTQHYRPIAPTLALVRSQDPAAQARGDLINFQIKASEYSPDLGATRATRQVRGVNPVTGMAITKSVGLPTTFRETSDPVFEEFLVHAVVNNQSELDSAALAAQEKNRFTQFATMETWGEPYLAPERVVALTGMAPSHSGYWTVRGVTHHIERNNYRCSASLATDGLGAPQRLVGEPMGDGNARLYLVDPHRAPGLPWPYPAPALEYSSQTIGVPGKPLNDFSWVAPVRNWSAV